MKKKIVLVVLVLSLVGTSAFAVGFDILSYPPPVKGGNLMIDLGIGIRSMGYSNATWKIPPLFAQVEYALPVGVPISVGGLFAVCSYGYKWDSYHSNAQWTWTDMNFAARANWHWGLEINWLDLYTGLSLGYTYSKFSSNYSSWEGSNYSGVFFAAQVGAHFYFTENVGIDVEFGYPYWVKAGLALKF